MTRHDGHVAGFDIAPPSERGAHDLRGALVEELARLGDLRTRRVADAMRRVPRHLFVPEEESLYVAYANCALPIGYGQTISQPSVVAMMTEALELEGEERVLEIGAGSGYQAAILSLLARDVFSVELLPDLAMAARERLAQLGYANARVTVGDGWKGWPERAPFDRVLVTAAAPRIPRALVEQLADGGILVCPVGPAGHEQTLVRARRQGEALALEELAPVRFVPLARG